MNPINTILLRPVDVLFFRDGRPMEGSLAGHGAAWPLPNVTDAALHAALHRSGLNGHKHDQMKHGERAVKDTRQFGSLVTAGPFPVHTPAEGGPNWFFPRPLDLMDDTLTPALLPVAGEWRNQSSLSSPLLHAMANRLAPSKESGAKTWIDGGAYHRYLDGGSRDTLTEHEALNDSAFSDSEATVGIAIDPATGTTGQGDAAGKIYSAKYLRLRDDWRLGVFAKTEEKNGSPNSRDDLVSKLISEKCELLIGGQQRLCTATRQSGGTIPLPRGKQAGFTEYGGRHLVKWVLLSPAIWPEIPACSKDGRAMTPHHGGWLPNWVSQDNGEVLLRHRAGAVRRDYSTTKARRVAETDEPISARLVAALVPKSIPVTGWALANDTDRPEGGAKSTHLAVPAGAVYYFEANSQENAAKLAAALNWHGSDTTFAAIKNRRSTLMGEKGFGLGVCGTWNFYPGPSV